MVKHWRWMAAGAGLAVLVVGIRLVSSHAGALSGGLNSAIHASARLAKQGQRARAIDALKQAIAEAPQDPAAAGAYLELGQFYEQADDLVHAREAYAAVLRAAPHPGLASAAQQQLGAVNTTLLFSPTPTSWDAAYQVKPGDSLTKIAKQFGTTVELIQRANHLTGDQIHAGQMLKVTQAAFSIVVDKSQNVLILKANDDVFKTYIVSTGNDNSTPVGTFTIVNRLIDPVWHHEGQAIPPGDPANILGTRWMGFTLPGYGIHGTTDPSSLGKQVTAGCVRMANQDVEELYAIIPVGTQVTIID